MPMPSVGRLTVLRIAAALGFLLAPGVLSAQSSLRFEDELAPFIQASTEIESVDGPVLIDFIATDGRGLLRFVRRSDGAVEFHSLSGPDDILPVLADRRFADLWPEMEQWAGSDLKAYAEAAIPVVEADLAEGHASPPDTTTEASLTVQARSILQLSEAYRAAGRVDESIDMLKAVASGISTESRRGMIDAALLHLRIAAIFETLGRPNRAISYLEAMAREFGRTDMVTNFTINRAAILAEQGRYEEALEAINLAAEQFENSSGVRRNVGDSVPGSQRHFDWIRACALAGLGRREEAERIIESVAAAPDPTEWGPVLDRTDQISLRGEICMRDSARVIDRLLAAIEDGGLVPDILVLLQPGFHHTSPMLDAFLREIRNDPRIQAATAQRMRVLPQSYWPALNAWRDTP